MTCINTSSSSSPCWGPLLFPQHAANKLLGNLLTLGDAMPCVALCLLVGASEAWSLAALTSATNNPATSGVIGFVPCELSKPKFVKMVKDIEVQKDGHSSVRHVAGMSQDTAFETHQLGKSSTALGSHRQPRMQGMTVCGRVGSWAQRQATQCRPPLQRTPPYQPL